MNHLSNPAFGIALSIIAYQTGVMLKQKFKSDIFNPLLLSMLMIIVFLKISNIPYEQYKIGGDYIRFFLNPLTVALGIMLYRQRCLIKQYFFSLILSITSGVVVSFLSIYGLGKSLNLDNRMILSALPKSITTPMAMSLTNIIGGDIPITLVLVVISGIWGAFIAPGIIKIFPTFNAIAKGIGIGTASHALGTSKALELGEEEGAFSSSAMALAGLISVIFVPILAKIFGLIN